MSRDDDGSGNVQAGAGLTMARTRKLTDLISMRLSPDDSEELDAVCEHIPMPRLTIARIALRLGLAELRKNPARVLDGKSKRTARRKR
jgi:hypothetical protein